MWLRRALVVAAKDWTLFRRDRFGFVLAFGFPVAFAVAFFFFLTPVFGDVSDSELIIRLSTRETSPDSLSRHVISELTSVAGRGAEFKEIGYDEGLQQTADGVISGFIAFPAGFTEAVTSGQRTVIEVHTFGGNQRATALRGFADGLADRFRLQSAVVNAVVAISVAEGAAPTVTEARAARAAQGLPDGGDAQTVTFRETQVGDIEPPNAANFTIPAYLVMYVFMAAAFMAEVVARERQTGLLERTATTGAGRRATLAGKFVFLSFRGGLQLLVMWLIGVAGFGVTLGEAPAATVMISLLVVVAAAAFGLMLSAVTSSVRSATALALLTSMVAAPLGGCWWPLFIVPAWMQGLAKVTPHGWANTAFNRLMLFGGDFGSVGYEMAALAAFGAAFIAVAFWRFRVV